MEADLSQLKTTNRQLMAGTAMKINVTLIYNTSNQNGSTSCWRMDPEPLRSQYSKWMSAPEQKISTFPALTGVSEALYIQNIPVTFCGVFGTSISIWLSLSLYKARLVSQTSSNIEFPASDSTLTQAWSSERKETPARMRTVEGSSSE